MTSSDAHHMRVPEARDDYKMLHVVVQKYDNTTRYFGLDAGDFVVVRGANGCGKTTLLRAIAGLGHADIDFVVTRYWQGRRLYDPDIVLQNNMHWLGHYQGLHDDLSVGEEWCFWQQLLLNQPMSAFDDRQYAAEQMGIAPLLHHQIARLSAGERQKVALGRLLLVPRLLWLLDEPDTHLDQASSTQLYQRILAHCHAGGMALVVSHQPELLRHASDIYEMN